MAGTSWSVSPSGRRVFRALTITGAAGGFLVYYLPNSYLLNKYKDVTQLYRRGIEVAVPKPVTSLVDEVMDDLRLTKLQRQFISTYTCYGFDLFHAGSTFVKTGGILGIPINFMFSARDDFDHQGITVNNEPVPWSSAKGESLKQSLILSKDAKKFGIAREITSLSTVQPFLNGAATAAIVGMVYVITSTVNARLNLYARPRSLRMVWYGLVYMFGGTFWTLLQDASTVDYEEDADRVVADISDTYAAGGLEFYEKVLQRNVALRALMGDKGVKIYTAYGNDQVLFRTKHLPFTLRRDYLKTRVEEYSQSKEEPLAVSDGQKVEQPNESKERSLADVVSGVEKVEQHNEESAGPVADAVSGVEKVEQHNEDTAGPVAVSGVQKVEQHNENTAGPVADAVSGVQKVEQHNEDKAGLVAAAASVIHTHPAS